MNILFDDSLSFPSLSTFHIDHNQLALEIGSLFLPGRFPLLTEFVGHENQFTGNIPPSLFDDMPLLEAFVVSQNPSLEGAIPSSSYSRYFQQELGFANNPLITGAFPSNVSARQMDFSYTGISGPVRFDNVPPRGLILNLNLAFTEVTCPIDASKVTVQNIHLQSAKFDGCNFNDPNDVNFVWSLITSIDVREQPHTRARRIVAHLILLLTSRFSFSVVVFPSAPLSLFRSLTFRGPPSPFAFGR